MGRECDICGKRIEPHDIENEVAVEIENQIFCGGCMIQYENDLKNVQRQSMRKSQLKEQAEKPVKTLPIGCKIYLCVVCPLIIVVLGLINMYIYDLYWEWFGLDIRPAQEAPEVEKQVIEPWGEKRQNELAGKMKNYIDRLKDKSPSGPLDAYVWYYKDHSDLLKEREQFLTFHLAQYFETNDAYGKASPAEKQAMFDEYLKKAIEDNPGTDDAEKSVFLDQYKGGALRKSEIVKFTEKVRPVHFAFRRNFSGEIEQGEIEYRARQQRSSADTDAAYTVPEKPVPDSDSPPEPEKKEPELIEVPPEPDFN